MKDNALITLSKQFAVAVIKLCTDKNQKNRNVLYDQLIRAGTSIGANIHEGNYASSKADFINKFHIALKECYETEYWLDIFIETDFITMEEYKNLQAKCNKIRIMLIASINTANSSTTQEKQ